VTVDACRVRRLAVRAALLALALVGVSLPALAGTLPPGAEVPAGRSVDLAAFTRLVATRYDVRFEQVIATDLDRDGDQDVIGAGGPGVVIWLNDGAGHLTSQAPRESTAVDRRAPASAWRERTSTIDEPLPGSMPSFNLPAGRRSTAPADPSHHLPRSVAVVIEIDREGARIPRAPPSLR
jgi:hypothetical protein